MSALSRALGIRIAGGSGDPRFVRILRKAAGTAAPDPPKDRVVVTQGVPPRPGELALEERPAVASLYDRYAGLVYRKALALLGSREEAEDLTQDVFATLCGPTAYDPSRGSMGTFLHAITRSRAIDRLRSRGRSARLLETWPEATPFADAPAMPSDGISTGRAAERVRAALARLRAVHRRVLEMAYYRGLSQQEIAAELDRPLGTVKSWSRRALHELRGALEELRA